MRTVVENGVYSAVSDVETLANIESVEICQCLRQLHESRVSARDGVETQRSELWQSLRQVSETVVPDSVTEADVQDMECQSTFTQVPQSQVGDIAASEVDFSQRVTSHS